nr:hypothetical protein [Abalone asfa-like virus]
MPSEQVINVVMVKKNLIDIFGTSQDELYTILQEKFPDDPELINNFLELIQQHQLDPFNHILTKNMPEINLRVLITNKLFLPIVRVQHGIPTRVSVNGTRYLDVDTSSFKYTAAEDLLYIIGVVFQPHKFSIFSNYNFVRAGPDWQTSGTYDLKNLPITTDFISFARLFDRFTDNLDAYPRAKELIPDAKLYLFDPDNFSADIDQLIQIYNNIKDYILGGAFARLTAQKIITEVQKHPVPELTPLMLTEPATARDISLLSKDLAEHTNNFNKYLNSTLATLSKVFQLSDVRQYSSTLFFDMFRLRVLHALTKWVNSDEPQQFIHIKMQEVLDNQILQNVKKIADQQEIKIQQYKKIILEKFGEGRLAKIKSVTYDGLLEELTDAEKTIIINEFERKERIWKEQIINKCPHVALSTKLRSNLTNNPSEIFQDLKAYFDDIPSDTWIMCKSCQFPVICPHVYHIYLHAGKPISYTEQKQILSKFNTLNSGNHRYYYCKICSEELFEVSSDSITGDVLGAMGNIDQEFKNMIWNESMKILKFVKFSAIINLKQFANISVNVCYPLIAQSEKKLLRNKQIEFGEEVFSPRLHLYTILFIYAYILNLIRSSNEGKMKVTLEGVPFGEKISTYVSVIIKLIKKNYFRLIVAQDNMTDEFLINRFREAYKMIIVNNGQQELVEVSSVISFINEVINIDPIYKYILDVAKISGATPIKVPNTKVLAKKEFETVIGTPMTNIIEFNKRSTELMGFLGKKTVMEFPAGVEPSYAYKNNNVRLYKTMYEGPALKKTSVSTLDKSKKILSKYASKSIRTWSGGADDLEITRELNNAIYEQAYKLFVRYIKYIKNREDWDNYITDHNDFITSEDGMLMLKSMKSNLAYFTFDKAGQPDQRTRQFHQKQIADSRITDIYDETGNRHKWNIFVYKSGSEEKEVKQQKLEQLPPDYELVDLKCSICGIRRSETDKLNVDTTLAALKISTDFSSFFTYFESRCPHGDLHEFNLKDNICKKCNVSIKLIKTYQENFAEAKKYYNKFIDIYNKNRESLSKFHKTKKYTNKEEISKELITQVKNWKYKYDDIMEVSNLFKVNIHLIESIGAYECRNITDIQDDINSPEPPDSFDDSRLIAGAATVQSLLSHYNMLRFYLRLSTPPQELQQLVKLHEDALAAIDKFSVYFPDIVGDYYQIKEIITQYHEPKTVLKFYINTLCQLLLKIYKIKGEHKWIEAIAKQFATDQLTNIMKSERLMAEPGTFDFAVFGGELVTGITDTSDDDLEAYFPAGTTGEDVTEESAEDPFSHEGTDIAGEENIEP